MSATPVRLAEIAAALSLATDLGMGQPLEFALCSCVLSVRLGDALGYSPALLREIYYQALLRYIGCNVETQMLAAIVGDEIALRTDFAAIDNGNLGQVVSVMVRSMWQTQSGTSTLAAIQSVARGMVRLPAVRSSFAAHCEVAQRLAQRLGFPPDIIYALGQLYERWDGKGLPRGLKGEAIAPAVLVVTLAQDALLFYRMGGLDSALAVVQERSGSAYAPFIAEAFRRSATQLFLDLDGASSWERVLAIEPGEAVTLDEAQLDAACQAMADFVDLKSTYTLEHSTRVAALAEEAARRGGLPAVDLRRAGLLHDIGKTGISSSIWEKQGELVSSEWERVRMHPYYTGRILAQADRLMPLGALGATHHERLDGSGFPLGLRGEALSPAARVLSAADFYCRKLERRPHRQALEPEEAAAELRREVHAGRMDGEAVNLVLAATGHTARAERRVAGLSEREIEVLRLIVQGMSTRQIAEKLIISPKTADHHIQHIYNKIGVATRAGATLYAVEHGLIG